MTSSTPPRRVISMRFIVTLTAVVLVSIAVLGVAVLAERHARRELTSEIETRLILEARSLSALGADALLDEFPELVLHPLVKELQASRPELAYAVVVDHAGIVQGHADARQLGGPYQSSTLSPRSTPDPRLDPRESVLEGNGLLEVRVPIQHDGKPLGFVHLGLHLDYVDARVAAARQMQLILVLVVLGLSIVATMALMSFLLRPIGELRRGLDRIGRGDLDQRVPRRGNTELSVLAESVNDMASKLASARQELVEKSRLDHEMELAHRIQIGLLPSGAVTAGEFLISGSHQSAAEVGGDYYDIFEFPDGRVGVAIADVAGKGLAGCMVTSMLAALVGALRHRHASPSSLLVALQRNLAPNLEPGVFVTMFYGVLDPRTDTLVYASAAHSPTLVCRAQSQEAEWHRTDGIPLCVASADMLARTLEDRTLTLDPGDLLVQYTDGFNEAFAEDHDEEFGFPRIEEAVLARASDGADRIIDSLTAAVRRWSGTRPPSDDQTLLLVSRERGSDARHTGDATRRSSNSPRAVLAEMLLNARHLRLRPSLDVLAHIGDWLREAQMGLTGEERRRVETALYEICANVIEHGQDPDADADIDIWWSCAADGMGNTDRLRRDALARSFFVVRDSGRAYQGPLPHGGEDSTPVRHQEGRGLGLALVRAASKVVHYYPATPAGNLTVLRFPSIPGTEESEELS